MVDLEALAVSTAKRVKCPWHDPPWCDAPDHMGCDDDVCAHALKVIREALTTAAASARVPAEVPAGAAAPGGKVNDGKGI